MTVRNETLLYVVLDVIGNRTEAQGPRIESLLWHSARLTAFINPGTGQPSENWPLLNSTSRASAHSVVSEQAGVEGEIIDSILCADVAIAADSPFAMQFEKNKKQTPVMKTMRIVHRSGDHKRERVELRVKHLRTS